MDSDSHQIQKSLEQSPLDYDLVKIAAVRRYNATKLLELLRPLRKSVTPLYDSLPEGVVPQTLPVLVTGASRDELYFKLNERGYGVVSLYHTLVEPIKESEFPDSHWLARRILNLPVHQDVSLEALKDMIAEMERLL